MPVYFFIDFFEGKSTLAGTSSDPLKRKRPASDQSLPECFEANESPGQQVRGFSFDARENLML
jgi:hypothetical protein